MKDRNILIGKQLAELVHTTTAWEEPLNGDDIVDIVKSFTRELTELNGEADEPLGISL